jgi:PTS system fructose-specific IIB component
VNFRLDSLSRRKSSKERGALNIVGISACAAGIAHTYIAKEKLVEAAEADGHTIHIETQGTVGTEDELDPADIAKADVVIIAADVSVSGKDRFKGIKTIEIPTELAIRSPHKLMKKIEEMVESK